MWHLYHAYNQLVSEGKVKPIACPDCDFKLVTVLNPADHTDGVWLMCVMCDSLFQPGLAVNEQVKAIVREHYL